MDSRPTSEGAQNVRRQTSPTYICPTCSLPYDKGRKRKLIDSCGHERCWTCMFKQEECPLCSNNISFKTTTEAQEEKVEAYGETGNANICFFCGKQCFNSLNQHHCDAHSEGEPGVHSDVKRSALEKNEQKPLMNTSKAISNQPLISEENSDSTFLNESKETIDIGCHIADESESKPHFPVILNVAESKELVHIPSDGAAKIANAVMRVVNVAMNIANKSSVKKVVSKTKDPVLKSVSEENQNDNELGDSQLICKYCGELCKNISHVNEHIFIHTGTGLCQCQICKRYFRTQDDLTEHQQVHREPKRYTCPVCDRMFTRKHYLESHVGCHATGRPYSCEICGKSFKQKITLTTHMKLHTGEFSATCSVCGKGFHQSGYLRTHMLSHTGEKPFTCDICGKGFTQKGRLNVHKQIHTEERPFYCEMCGKNYVTKGALYVHKRAVHHKGSKRHKCEKCGKMFLMLHQLTEHLRSHDGTKRSQCDVCGKNLKNNDTLRRHYLIHTGEKPYKCEVCDMQFRQYVARQTHMLIHTGEKPLSCKICEMKFRHRSTLRCHMRKHENSTKHDGQ